MRFMIAAAWSLQGAVESRGQLSHGERRDRDRSPGRNEFQPRRADGQLSERKRHQLQLARRRPNARRYERPLENRYRAVPISTPFVDVPPLWTPQRTLHWNLPETSGEALR
jgi:hypothetical protein